MKSSNCLLCSLITRASSKLHIRWQIADSTTPLALAAKADSGQIIFRVEKINVIYDFTPHFSFDFAEEKLEPELHKRIQFKCVQLLCLNIQNHGIYTVIITALSQN